MDVWSFLVGTGEAQQARELQRAEDAKRAEVAAAWAEYLRLEAEADALFEAQKAAHARWFALQRELHQAELAAMAGPPGPEKH